MKIGVLLAGSGVYDGSEIQESVFTLLALEQCGATALCMAPNIEQHHVVNHLTGEEMDEQRNVMIEAARIARGAVVDLASVDINELDGLVIPGGFGAAKNLNQWALHGPEGGIQASVKALILDCVKAGKPVAGLCMGPTVIASALAGEDIFASMTVGSTEAASSYDIAGIHAGMQALGAIPGEATLEEVLVDTTNKIVTAPCYMMEGSMTAVFENVGMAIVELVRLIQGEYEEEPTANA